MDESVGRGRKEREGKKERPSREENGQRDRKPEEANKYRLGKRTVKFSAGILER